ncbi:hypothetical protein Trydic_g21648 [Trypoxylus dichotomus]
MVKDRKVTVQELCEMFPDVSRTYIDKVLTDHLGYAKVCARWLPRMFMENHEQQRMQVVSEFLQVSAVDGEEFLDSIFTGDPLLLSALRLFLQSAAGLEKVFPGLHCSLLVKERFS